MKKLQTRSLFAILSFICLSVTTYAQINNDDIKGSVSYISSNNIYVKFVNTNGIRIGDTLFIIRNNKYQPALIVKNLSSISCIGNEINGIKLSITNELFAKKRKELPIEVTTQQSNEAVAINDQAIKAVGKNDTNVVDKARTDGRISISSYTTFSDYSSSYQRFKYNLALNAEHIGNSKLSFESYLSFTHKLDSTEKYDGLRIYNLSLNYDFSKTASLTIGRKINVNMANIGAVDGIQFEKRFKNFSIGALAGTRPNDSTYGFDKNLFQYGAFLSHKVQNLSGIMQTSAAYFNQTNNLLTDRRYLYFQHSNSLLSNLDLFASAEVDLYKLSNNIPTNNFDLTSTYVSLSYRPVTNLSLSISYDVRKNIYFYETYKNKIDSTLEKEMRQGLRFRFNYRPFKYFNWGGSAGYRVQSSTSKESMNAMSYLTYSRIPFIDVSTTITGTALKTANYSGLIYGISMSKEIIDGKLSADIEYRRAEIFVQDIAEISLSWRLSKKLMLSADYEETFETAGNSGRFFINLTQRF